MVLLEHFKEYFRNTTIHGMHFILEDDRHWTERLFWIVCCLISWYGSIRLILSAIAAYRYNAVSFVVDTTYLDWNTSFPAVSICETENPDSVSAYSLSMYGEDRDYNIDEVLAEIAYFQGITYFTNEFCPNEGANCPIGNYNAIVSAIRSPCEDVLSECTWNEYTRFNCCRYFENKETEFGICYTLNTNSLRKSYFTMNSNRKNGPGRLLMKTSAVVQLYLHSDHDMPFYNSHTSETLKSIPRFHMRHAISVRNVENEPELRLIDVDQRNCRFGEENYLTVSDKYSYSSCLVECRMRRQLELCNCTSHLMPRTSEKLHCDYEGILCLHRMYTDYIALKPDWEDKPGLSCNCLPSCEEIEMEIIAQESFRSDDDQSAIELVLHHLPSERFKRTVVRKRVDLLVYFGGAIALFVGASILSFVEIVYYFTVRLCTKYLTQHADENRSQQTRLLQVTEYRSSVWKNSHSHEPSSLYSRFGLRAQ